MAILGVAGPAEISIDARFAASLTKSTVPPRFQKGANRPKVFSGGQGIRTSKEIAEKIEVPLTGAAESGAFKEIDSLIQSEIAELIVSWPTLSSKIRSNILHYLRQRREVL